MMFVPVCMLKSPRESFQERLAHLGRAAHATDERDGVITLDRHRDDGSDVIYETNSP
jgi:hypothetical protein